MWLLLVRRGWRVVECHACAALTSRSSPFCMRWRHSLWPPSCLHGAGSNCPTQRHSVFLAGCFYHCLLPRRSLGGIGDTCMERPLSPVEHAVLADPSARRLRGRRLDHFALSSISFYGNAGFSAAGMGDGDHGGEIRPMWAVSISGDLVTTAPPQTWSMKTRRP